MSAVNVLIATPCAHNSVTIGYCTTITNLIKYKYNIPSDVNIDLQQAIASNVIYGRNGLAAAFLLKEQYTHLFFVDADMQFHPRLLEKLLRFDKPFVAALYPERQMDAERHHAMARLHSDPIKAERLASTFVQSGALIGKPDASGRRSFRMVDGFIRTASVGAGAMLLHRSVFHTLRDAYPELLTSERETSYRMFAGDARVLQCFAPMQNEHGDFLSEDLSFCRRWTRCGGEIWACVDEDVTHIGYREFTSAYLDKLKAGLF